MEHESDSDTICNSCTRNDHQRPSKGAGRVKNRRSNRDRLNYIFQTDQNTEKSAGDLRRLAVTQTPVKGHQLTLM